MKITKFSATKVHGHYNFDFHFLPDVSFLVGINGSGKTSALRLIQATLSMDLATLQTIRFSKLSLTVDRDGRQQNITITNQGNSLLIAFNGEISNSKISFLGDEERLLFLKNDRLEDYFEQSRLTFLKSLSDAERRLISGERPLFLGLERKTNRYDEELFYADENRALNMRHSSIARKEMMDGLENCGRLIEKSYKNYRKVSDLTYSKLIKVLIESTFDYIEFDSQSFENPKSQYLELQELLTRRDELERFAFSFSEGTLFSGTIEKFFNKITTLMKSNSHDAKGFNLELLLNKAQIKRFQRIFIEMDTQKRNAEKAYAPIKGFVDAMNRFLEISKKSVEIDNIGRLRVSHYGEAIPLQSLSSGEKQLIILMAHSAFSKNKGGVFIVDEPELSLHLRWQEMLVEELTATNRNNQFIFATHSPEIVGFLKNNCVRVG